MDGSLPPRSFTSVDMPVNRNADNRTHSAPRKFGGNPRQNTFQLAANRRQLAISGLWELTVQ